MPGIWEDSDEISGLQMQDPHPQSPGRGSGWVWESRSTASPGGCGHRGTGISQAPGPRALPPQQFSLVHSEAQPCVQSPRAPHISVLPTGLLVSSSKFCPSSFGVRHGILYSDTHKVQFRTSHILTYLFSERRKVGGGKKRVKMRTKGLYHYKWTSQQG